MSKLTPVVFACDPGTITTPTNPLVSRCIILGTGDMQAKAEHITRSVTTHLENVSIRIVSIANSSYLAKRAQTIEESSKGDELHDN